MMTLEVNSLNKVICNGEIVFVLFYHIISVTNSFPFPGQTYIWNGGKTEA